MMLRIGVATIVGVISIALSIHYMKLGMVSHPLPSDIGFVDYIRYMLHQSCNRYEIYSMLLWAIGGAALLYAIFLTYVKLNNWSHFKKGHILNPVWPVWSFWVKHSNRLRRWISFEKLPWKSRKLLWQARKGQKSNFEMLKSRILSSFGGSSTYICYMHAYDVWASPYIGSCHYVYENCIGTWLLLRYSVYAVPPKEGFLSASLADRL